MIERYAAHAQPVAVLYLDSVGDGSCLDSDGDGIDAVRVSAVMASTSSSAFQTAA